MASVAGKRNKPKSFFDSSGILDTKRRKTTAPSKARSRKSARLETHEPDSLSSPSRPLQPTEPLPGRQEVACRTACPVLSVSESNSPTHPQSHEQGLGNEKDVKSLNDSLRQSYERWINGSVLEKYLAKPVQKKGGPQDARLVYSRRPVALGSCSIWAEPHVFQAKIYGLRQEEERKRHSPSHVPSGAGGSPLPLHSKQSSRATMSMPQLAQHPAAPSSQAPRNGVSSGLGDPPSQQHTQPESPSISSGYHNNHGVACETTGALGPQHPTPPQQGPDPVIQMLAQKAATDEKLKALMRIVAQGDGTTDQLQAFQSHVDVFTAELRSRTLDGPHGPRLTARHPALQPESCGTQNALPARHDSPNVVEFHTGPPTSTTPRADSRSPGLVTVHRALKFPILSEPLNEAYKTILIEWTDISRDRYLLPSHAILQRLAPTCALISFMLFPSPLEANEPSTPPPQFPNCTPNVYEVVTLRVVADAVSVMECLVRSLKSRKDTLGYMRDTMDHGIRASDVW